jgi:hypothetical protein
MSLSHHQRQLHRIESALLGADPQLAEMLGIFGKLSAGQAMPSWEQVPTRPDAETTTTLRPWTGSAACAASGASCATVVRLQGSRWPGCSRLSRPDPAVAGSW